MKKTFYYSENNQEWITGPELKEGRRQHAAGLGTDTTTSEHYIAVTGGIGNSLYYLGYLDSVEILFSGDTEWQTGKQHLFHFLLWVIHTSVKTVRTKYVK